MHLLSFSSSYPTINSSGKVNAGSPHKYRLSALLSDIQTRRVWLDFGYFNVVIYTI